MEDEALKLDNQLCFPLYACAREVVKLYKPFLSAIGLTYTQYIAMMVLWEEKEVSIKRLGERLHLDSGTLTPLLKRMEKQGLLTRCRSQEDERSVLIQITAQGEALKAQAIHVPEKMMQCVPLDKEEAVTLYRLLYRLLGEMQAQD